MPSRKYNQERQSNRLKNPGVPFIQTPFFICITDIKRWDFKEKCGGPQSMIAPRTTAIPFVFFNDTAQVNFNVRQKSSVYFYHPLDEEIRFICPKEGQMLQIEAANECFLNPSSEMYSLQLNPSKLSYIYEVSYLKQIKNIHSFNCFIQPASPWIIYGVPPNNTSPLSSILYALFSFLPS